MTIFTVGYPSDSWASFLQSYELLKPKGSKFEVAGRQCEEFWKTSSEPLPPDSDLHGERRMPSSTSFRAKP